MHFSFLKFDLSVTCVTCSPPVNSLLPFSSPVHRCPIIVHAVTLIFLFSPPCHPSPPLLALLLGPWISEEQVLVDLVWQGTNSIKEEVDKCHTQACSCA
jgi:hypothetical protein